MPMFAPNSFQSCSYMVKARPLVAERSIIGPAPLSSVVREEPCGWREDHEANVPFSCLELSRASRLTDCMNCLKSPRPRQKSPNHDTEQTALAPFHFPA